MTCIVQPLLISPWGQHPCDNLVEKAADRAGIDLVDYLKLRVVKLFE